MKTRSQQVEEATRNAALASYSPSALLMLTTELERLAVLLPAEAKSIRQAVQGVSCKACGEGITRHYEVFSGPLWLHDDYANETHPAVPKDDA